MNFKLWTMNYYALINQIDFLNRSVQKKVRMYIIIRLPNIQLNELCKQADQLHKIRWYAHKFQWWR